MIKTIGPIVNLALVIHCSWFGYILQIDNSYLLKSIQTVVSQYYNIVVNETRDQDVLNIHTTRVIS